MLVLRDYQSSTVRELTTTEDDVAVEQPTGSGKTVTVVAASALRVATTGSKLLIAAPQEHIESAFVHRAYTRITGCGDPIEVPAGRVRAARDGGQSVAAIREYLRSSSVGHALVCTHAALTRMKPPTDIPGDLRGSWLVVDEAQHSAATGLSQFVTAWRRAGGRLIFFTATAYRADDVPVVLPEMRVLRRTLSEHMAAGFCPGRIVSSVNTIRGLDNVSVRQFFGEDAPPERIGRGIVSEMVTKWRNDGSPKLVVRVPILRGGCGPFVSQLLQGFANAGARTLDMTGGHSRDKRRVLDAISEERACSSFRDSQYDVLVGVQRVTEGLDWPWCSDVYCVGLPRGLATLVQLLGRATRLKSAADYPARHADRAGLHLFVPCQSGQVAAISEQHVRSIMLTCAFLEDSNAAHAWLSCKGKGEHSALPLFSAPREEEPIVDIPYIDPVLRAEVAAAITEAIRWLHARGCVATDVEIYRAAVAAFPQLDTAVLKHVIVERHLRAGGKSAQALKTRLVGLLHLSPGGKRAAIVAAFDAILADFRGYVILESTATGSLSQQLLELSGGTIRDFATRLFHSRPLSPAWVRIEAERHHDQTGVFPNRASGPISHWAETWYDVDTAIRGGTRGWPNATPGGLREFCRSEIESRRLIQVFDQMQTDIQLSEPEAAILRYLRRQEFPIVGGGRRQRWRAAIGLSSFDTTITAMLFRGLSSVACAQPLGPLLCIYCDNLWENMARWAECRRLSEIRRPSAQDKSGSTQYLRQTPVRVAVRPGTRIENSRDPAAPPLRVGDRFLGVLWRCHLSETAQTMRYDCPPRYSLQVEEDIFREEAHYVSPVVEIGIGFSDGRFSYELEDRSLPSVREAICDVSANLITEVYHRGVWSRVPADWDAALQRCPSLREASERPELLRSSDD